MSHLYIKGKAMGPIQSLGALHKISDENQMIPHYSIHTASCFQDMF